MLKTIPNILTALRIVLALSGATALITSYNWSLGGDVPEALGDPVLATRGLAIFSVCAFLIAAVSDWLDGYLARRWSAQSRLGTVLDPIADKLLVDAYLLVYTMILDAPLYLVVPVAAIVLRDAVITLTRMVSRDAPDTVLPVSPAAKLKTAIALAVTAFPLLVFAMNWQGTPVLLEAWLVMVWITAAMSLATGLSYLRRKPAGGA